MSEIEVGRKDKKTDYRGQTGLAEYFCYEHQRHQQLLLYLKKK